MHSCACPPVHPLQDRRAICQKRDGSISNWPNCCWAATRLAGLPFQISSARRNAASAAASRPRAVPVSTRFCSRYASDCRRLANPSGSIRSADSLAALASCSRPSSRSRCASSFRAMAASSAAFGRCVSCAPQFIAIRRIDTACTIPWHRRISRPSSVHPNLTCSAIFPPECANRRPVLRADVGIHAAVSMNC